MEILALIPARGGSKGIPRKNLASFLGEPLVVHSIRHGLACEAIQRVVVSTDDEEIAEVSRRAGAEVPFLRPAPLAGDEVLDYPVFRHALEALQEAEGYAPDLVVHLRPTAPHRDPAWIEAAIEALVANPEADSIRSVSPPAAHPYRVFEITAEGLLDPVMKHRHPEPHLLRRQEHPPMYHYNCVIDVTRRRTLLELESMTGARMLPHVMAAEDVFDIDTIEDLRRAEATLRARREATS